MQAENTKRNELRRVGLKLSLVLFDVFAVNFSYFMALVLRFYVNHAFHESGAKYVPMFYRFAPYYTICCILVFGAFKLYSGMLRYAGYNDVKRILRANAVTCLIQIVGTLLFVQRMPVTYYAIGAVVQFFMIAVSRLSYRFLTIELSKLHGNAASIPVMIIGAGETARKVIRRFGDDSSVIGMPVCAIDYRKRDTGMLLDGVHVVGGLDEMEAAAEKYGVKSVVVADSLMPQDVREEVYARCRELGLEMQDVSVFTNGGELGFRALLERTNGPLEVVLDGKPQYFDNNEQAAREISGKTTVKAVRAERDRLVIELEKDRTVINSLDEAWVRDYVEETGENVSFF